ncbi:MAG: twin-arginine translocation signal domain-containing protein, partial [Gemmatimonadetes bacterium]|nr:twin-arginine translocation signal domain-containing protein [Gemmatimonadota bacterium]
MTTSRRDFVRTAAAAGALVGAGIDPVLASASAPAGAA